ncbi:MAG: NUDIX domain-containing protein [Verrucomicrobiota bacterium]
MPDVSQIVDAKSIRVRAAAIFVNRNRLLVHVVENQDDGKIWHIPPGGGIQYGESSVDALKKEIKEELDWSISGEQLIGSFESYHSINGMKEHEISFVYLAKLLNSSDLSYASREVIEDNGKKKTFQWMDLETLKHPRSLLYPEGLLEKIEANQSLQATRTSPAA